MKDGCKDGINGIYRYNWLYGYDSLCDINHYDTKLQDFYAYVWTFAGFFSRQWLGGWSRCMVVFPTHSQTQFYPTILVAVWPLKQGGDRPQSRKVERWYVMVDMHKFFWCLYKVVPPSCACWV